MTEVSPDAVAEQIVNLLRSRDGIATEVRTRSGQTYVVYNIAWGQDMGDPEYHITSNISPSPPDEPPINFFFTHEVTELGAPESGAILFARGGV